MFNIILYDNIIVMWAPRGKTIGTQTNVKGDSQEWLLVKLEYYLTEGQSEGKQRGTVFKE